MLKLLKLKTIKNKKNVLSNEGKNRGVIKHYPSSDQEWFNTIYTFNKNTIKLFPVANKLVHDLIKSYFNMYKWLLKKKLKKKNKRFLRLRYIYILKKRLSKNKILISKPKIKHTNDKIIITLYIYNRQYNLALKKILLTLSEIKNKLKNNNINSILKNKYNLVKNKLDIIYINKLNLINKINKKLKKKYNNNINFILEKLIKKEKNNYLLKIIKKYYLKRIMLAYNYILKTKNTYILPLKVLIENLYGKKVEFNIITLKNIYFNSDIFVQGITLETKDRKKSILKIMRTSLLKIKLIGFNKALIERESTKYLGLQNLILNNLILLKNKKINNEYLNIILKNNFKNIDKKDNILNFIKYRDINGAKIEGSGRLTKRIKASRAIFKFKYIGTLKNIDSSYKGLSIVNLKGNQKPNIQYSQSNSKRKIGAFGIKGWINGI